MKPAPTLRALLSNVIDYAGLFPPASLPMARVVENYARYSSSSDAWALGRLIVPAGRLVEFAGEVHRGDIEIIQPWRIGAVLGGDPRADATAIAAFNAEHAGRLCVDAAEGRLTAAATIPEMAEALRGIAELYVEIALEEMPAQIDAVRAAGVRAKIRTGGVVPSAIPSTDAVRHFIIINCHADVSYKATAGLHHPLRAEHALTYEPGAPRAVMHGFLNVFIAAAFARAGYNEPELLELLDEPDGTAFQFTDDEIGWRRHRVTLDRIFETRERSAVAFGSCSFVEPMADLRSLGLL